jgi:hypothetical protein
MMVCSSCGQEVRFMLEAAGQQELAVPRGLAAPTDALIAQGHGEADTSVLALEAVDHAGR